MITSASSTHLPAAGAPASRIGPSPRRPGEPGDPGDAGARTDRFEPSNSARASQDPSTGSDIRTDLVERIRGELRGGAYESGEKFEIAVRRAIRSIDLTA